MKKTYLIVPVLMAAIVTGSCKKDQVNENSASQASSGRTTFSSSGTNTRVALPNCSIKDPVTYYSEKLKTDSLFRKFIYGIIDNQELVFRQVQSRLGNRFAYDQFVSSYTTLMNGDGYGTLQLLLRHGVDTAFFLDRVAASIADGVLFYGDNPCFFKLTPSQLTVVLNNVLAGKSPLAKLSWGEFTACAVAAIGGFVASYGGVVGQVYSMLTQGSGYLSWSDVWSLSKKIVKSAVSWWAVVGTLIEFGACLWAAW